jgi:penicillin amidase
MKFIKITVVTLLGLSLAAFIVGYAFLLSHLPTLDGEKISAVMQNEGTIERDVLGTAVISAETQQEAAFLLGYAHAQDRLFQMDLLRRNSAGELSEIVGERAIKNDERARFFQFRKRAKAAFLTLPQRHQDLLTHYANGVNTFIEENGSNGLEFAITGAKMLPWREEDSLLANYSMYMDLQAAQVERDLENTLIAKSFGQGMLDFIHQPSPFQAAIDLSEISAPQAPVPSLNIMPGFDKNKTDDPDNTKGTEKLALYTPIEEPKDIGSNNWVVSGNLTDSASAMLSSDMHLGLNVPTLWYRAQLNYIQDDKDVSITGVSLPGTPIIIAGSNGYIAWGFTNSNVDNVDWVRLSDSTPTSIIEENIALPDNQNHTYSLEMSEFGPVRELAGEKYALKWVALTPYGGNMQSADMPLKRSVSDALEHAKKIAIPVQNMVIADAQGNIAWQLTGAITSRTRPSLQAIEEQDVDAVAWAAQESDPAKRVNPDNDRLWTANARVVSADDLPRYGNAGYALGIRQLQIADALLARSTFDEQDFYNLQLDNRALFLKPWHALLKTALSAQSKEFERDIEALNEWQACACSDSIGYSLVRRFRSEVINQLMAPVDKQLKDYELRLRYSINGIEPGIWQLLEQQAQQWLPEQYNTYDAFLLGAYQNSKTKLLEAHNGDPVSLAGLEWGNVNALTVTHPFADALGPLAKLVNMPIIQGFGDSFMPAVQGRSFGASQRLIVRPGELDKAILTLPGGQSMHPLSEFFEAGFMEYAQGDNTPLLPQEIVHKIVFKPAL